MNEKSESEHRKKDADAERLNSKTTKEVRDRK